jgi:hypothetical protein
MLMLKTTHDRIVADDAKTLGEQAQLIAKLTAERDECKSTAAKVFTANLKLASQVKDLRDRNLDLWSRVDVAETRLAVFTAPRPRGAGGKFVSTKGAQV